MIAEAVAWFGDAANWSGPGGVPARVLEHVGYVALALAIALVLAVPVGLLVGHTGRGAVLLVGAGNIVRALPTLGVVTLFFLLLAESTPAAVVGLVVLAVPPVMAGTYAGVQSVDAHVVDAASGVGMRGMQRLWQVEVPIALPMVLGGVRNAVLQLVATAAVAAYVGLGGLGRYLMDGLAILDYAEVVAGALLTAALAVVLDLLLAGLQRIMVPRGVRLAELTTSKGPA
ncbi:osmoprotectant transport system permease protein [Prauserella isguenensis]|uniref:Osmoprotectant transport system permease protein n=1 Tax=Prauserella isguenensis TaxID=1470180 RepID=A0A839S4M7_9PSEU|nr:ABC transporter permease subunit [Prauserella isguenensis]MBB3052243.1 osmoprotectant transport system permease protein [Prauserella isguenensis]